MPRGKRRIVSLDVLRKRLQPAVFERAMQLIEELPNASHTVIALKMRGEGHWIMARSIGNLKHARGLPAGAQAELSISERVKMRWGNQPMPERVAMWNKLLEAKKGMRKALSNANEDDVQRLSARLEEMQAVINAMKYLVPKTERQKESNMQQ
jgi:hypothetical protein